MEKRLNPGNAISPIDGRYYGKTEELSEIFSEFALMRYRVQVEVEYLIALDDILDTASIIRAIIPAKHLIASDNILDAAPIIREITPQERIDLRELYLRFNEDDFSAIKDFEKKTNHDVKAVEYFIRDEMTGTVLDDLKGFVHYGLTSEDPNNLAYALMLRDGVAILLDNYETTIEGIDNIAKQAKDTAMLGLTHGQPASPTTLDWEMNIFSDRLKKRLDAIKKLSLSVKWGGATGGNNALYAAHPNIDWRLFSKTFINSFQSERAGSMIFILNEYTNQIEPHDTYAALFNSIKEANSVLLDFSKDIWAYISREIFVQQAIKDEVGSSTMPNKINPINFENAEGNLGVANALFDHFSAKLPISRFQRDLSDSTVERYFGIPFGSTLIALKALCAGMKRLSINHLHIYEELDNHWEVISEAYQMILRREGISEAYELLKELTRGKKNTKELLHDFIDQAAEKYSLSEAVVSELKAITPHNYIGNRTF